MKKVPVLGKGEIHAKLTNEDVRSIVCQLFQEWKPDGKRLLFIIPDGTRRAPIALLFRLFAGELMERVRKMDYLIALGTHQPMHTDAICRRVGITPEDREGRFHDINIINHHWDDPNTMVQLGTISKEDMTRYSDGLMPFDLQVKINHLVLDYDQLIICGPVFPHEVVGFSGGNKYLFPGICGPEVIDFTHWLGALQTSMKIIGTKETSVRTVIDQAASLIPTPTLAFCPVMQGDDICGMYAGETVEAWSRAADLSAQVHIRYVEKPYQQAFCVIPEMYEDLWTAAKGVYKTEPVIADGGEVILFAPHITEISYTHGKILDEIGYHVRDYFVKQWSKFKKYPLSVLAHSTHARGVGTYENGVEKPRIKVTLASRVSKDRCRKLGLGYADPDFLQPFSYENREGVLFEPHAGEMLYRLADTQTTS